MVVTSSVNRYRTNERFEKHVINVIIHIDIQVHIAKILIHLQVLDAGNFGRFYNLFFQFGFIFEIKIRDIFTKNNRKKGFSFVRRIEVIHDQIQAFYDAVFSKLITDVVKIQLNFIVCFVFVCIQFLLIIYGFVSNNSLVQLNSKRLIWWTDYNFFMQV